MRTTALLLLLATCVAPVRADGPPPTTDADRARGAELVARWTELDPSLLGEAHYGVHAGGPGNAGSLRLTVEAAPVGSGVAVYELTVAGKQGFGGGQQRDQDETALLDAHLGLVSVESRLGGAAGVISRRARREGGGWTVVREQAGRAMRGEDPAAPTANYAEDWLLALLARRLAREGPAVYELPGLEWVQRAGAFTARPTTVVVRVGEPATVVHRDREVRAVLVSVWRGGRGPLEHVVDLEGKLLELRPAEGLRVIAGTPEEVVADLPVAPPSPDEEAARAAAMTWFRVILKLADPDSLDPVIDWEALRAGVASVDPAAARPDAAAFATETKRQLRAGPPPPPGLGRTPEDALKNLGGMLQFTVTGDEALARVGPNVAMRLRRVDGAWRIVELPLPGR